VAIPLVEDNINDSLFVTSAGRTSNFFGEFDPGSGRTLAACLTHASRTMNFLREGISGERVSNT